MIDVVRSVALALAALSFAGQAGAAETAPFESPALVATLLTVEDGVPPDSQSLSAGLSIELEEGWKTYWRSPGEVGLPPSIDWSGSTNVAEAELLWPAPSRFRAFGIENFGYEGSVLHPIRIALKEPGQPAELRASVSLLACSDICVPIEFNLDLTLQPGLGIDRAAAAEIAEWAARIPTDADASDMVLRTAAIDDARDALVVEIAREAAWAGPDLFPEIGTAGTNAAVFGAPDIRLSDDGRTLWAALPVLSLSDRSRPLNLTVTDGSEAVVFTSISVEGTAPEPPYEADVRAASVLQTAWIVLLAFLGGLVLNLMPCVLPVLSIKLSSALKMAQSDARRVRAGFLATAAGTLAFMWSLAAIVLALRSLGYAVGWGTQFQNPYFLVGLVFVMGLFSMSLLGLFEFRLPQSIGTRLALVGNQGHAGDFATGAFAAILATPCSAPLLGTAVAFALTGSSLDVLIVFTAMGVGLASPYLAVAARPRLVAALPRPGRWMAAVKAALGFALVATVAWLIWVLSGVASPTVAGVVLLALAILCGALILLRAAPQRRAWAISAAVAATALMAVAPVAVPTDRRAVPDDGLIAWTAFDRAAIARYVSRGETVFVDVTADWCLTCKANKALVLERRPVIDALEAEGIVPMVADWTQPDPTISAFLEANGRFGIPFNIVFGPAAPEGIPLPEILTSEAVMMAIEAASPGPDALAGTN